VILEVDPRSAVPPYEQLRLQIAALVTGGALAPGARLPTIRQLAGDLGLAGGTVARAYKELEASGFVESRGRHGTVVAGPPASSRAPASELLDAARSFAATATESGASMEAALAAVRAAFVLPARSAT
jgi:GntR family transcriptional regulator